MKAHRAGKSHLKDLLIQPSNSTKQAACQIDFIEPSEMDNHAIMRFTDPWGRIGIAIRFCYHFEDKQGKCVRFEKVLALHQRTNSQNSPWMSATNIQEQIKGPCLTSFFPIGWEKCPDSLNYLTQLINGQPCKGHLNTNGTESSCFLTKHPDIPVIQLWNHKVA